MNDKLKSVYKLLSERHLTIVGDVRDDLKCCICRNILIDAHLANCGCHFCMRCIEEFKNNGGIFCPGNNDECKDSDLSNIVINNNANRQISRLLVRCDEENCNFECELINLDTHLKKCSKKRINCPFNVVGCKEMLGGDKMNDHLQMESYNHSLLLMELISILRNEINELRDEGRSYRCDITIILEDRERNNNDINELKKENEERKLEYEIVEKEIGNIKNEMMKFEELTNENEENCKDILKMIKENKNECCKLVKKSTTDLIKRKELDSLMKEIEDLRTKMKDGEEKMRTMISDGNSLQNGRYEQMNEDIKFIKLETKEMLTEITEQIKSISIDNKEWKKDMEKMTESNVLLKDEIIDLWKKEIDFVKEELFAMLNERCKMKDVELLIYKNIKSMKVEMEIEETKIKESIKKENEEMRKRKIGLEKFLDKRFASFVWNIGSVCELKRRIDIFSEFFYDRNNLYKMRLKLLYCGWFEYISINLQVSKGEENSQLKLPFKTKVTIKIFDKVDPKITESITQNCTINQPIRNDQYIESDYFRFEAPDLYKICVWKNPNWIIECFIDLE